MIPGIAETQSERRHGEGTIAAEPTLSEVC